VELLHYPQSDWHKLFSIDVLVCVYVCVCVQNQIIHSYNVYYSLLNNQLVLRPVFHFIALYCLCHKMTSGVTKPFKYNSGHLINWLCSKINSSLVDTSLTVQFTYSLPWSISDKLSAVCCFYFVFYPSFLSSSLVFLYPFGHK